jgi:hypothetical protein
MWAAVVAEALLRHNPHRHSGARASANPESSLRFEARWIPGSPLTRRPGTTREAVRYPDGAGDDSLNRALSPHRDNFNHIRNNAAPATRQHAA